MLTSAIETVSKSLDAKLLPIIARPTDVLSTEQTESTSRFYKNSKRVSKWLIKTSQATALEQTSTATQRT